MPLSLSATNKLFYILYICCGWNWFLSAYCLVIHAGIATGVGRAFSCVCLSVILYVCLHSNRKMAWAINTKLGTHILYSSRLACTDPEVKRSKVKITRLRKLSKSVTFACFWLVCAPKGKRLELSTPNSAHVYSIAVSRHALTHKSKGHRSRSQGYKNRHGARLLVTMAGTAYSCALLPAAIASVGLSACFLV